MNVSVNSYYSWLRTIDKPKNQSQTSFYKERIKRVWEKNRKVYGSARIQKQLEREKIYLNRSYIAYLMKQMGIRSVIYKTFKVMTTDSNHKLPIAENVLNTVYKTWLKATQARQITKNHIFHSDRSVQYASTKTKDLFMYNVKITQSMSRKGNCWDNAVAESFFKTLKYECTNRYIFKSILKTHRTI